MADENKSAPDDARSKNASKEGVEQETTGKTDQKTQGDDIHEIIKKVDDNVSGVWKMAHEGFKEIKNLESMLSSSGISGMASQAMQMAMQMAGSKAGGGAVASALQNMSGQAGAASWESEALQEAMDQVNERLTALEDVSALVIALNSACSMLTSGTITQDQFATYIDDAVTIILGAASAELSWLDETVTNDFFLATVNFLNTLSILDVPHLEGYPMSHAIRGIETCIGKMDFNGMDRKQFTASGTLLVSTMRTCVLRTILPTTTYGLDSAATGLETALATADVWSDPDELSRIAAAQTVDDILALIANGHLSVEDLTALMAKMLALLQEMGAQKALGQGMQGMSGSASSLIPNVGSMVEQTLKDFLPKSINDAEKIKKVLDKFTYKQAREQKVKKAAEKIVSQKNKKPSARPAAAPQQVVPATPIGSQTIIGGVGNFNSPPSLPWPGS